MAERCIATHVAFSALGGMGCELPDKSSHNFKPKIPRLISLSLFAQMLN